MYGLNPLLAIDFYKADHRRQYPKGTTKVYSNLTARHGKHSFTPGDHIVFFGLQAFIEAFLVKTWNEGFFQRGKKDVCGEYQHFMDKAMGKGAIPVDHIEALHDLGYLPILIKALPEGSIVPYGVPVLTIENTHPDFFWLTNYLETVMSSELWKGCTSATTADAYKQRFLTHCGLTGSPVDFVPWQGHDFSYRGMSGSNDAMMSGAAHLLLFTGTDCVPAIDFLNRYYFGYNTFVGGSVPATEHSVMCMGTQSSEFETFKRLITEVYPSGIVSIVSDTWDFWQVIKEFLPRLKSEILNRDGRVVIRPDSGDPVKIVCGDPLASDPHVRKGLYESLWDIFGGEVNSKGYKVLDEHIGAIYGDAITLERQNEMLNQLRWKGFTASNLVLGIGSFTYQCVTRDTHGFAVKATYGEIEGKPRDIFKNPKTDDGSKKSAKGRLAVLKSLSGEYSLVESPNSEDLKNDALMDVFKNGEHLVRESLRSIRIRLQGGQQE